MTGRVPSGACADRGVRSRIQEPFPMCVGSHSEPRVWGPRLVCPEWQGLEEACAGHQRMRATHLWTGAHCPLISCVVGWEWLAESTSPAGLTGASLPQ